MSKPYVAHFDSSGSEEHEAFVRRYADHYGLDVMTVRQEKRFHGEGAGALIGAAMVIIWNGMHFMGPLASNLCRNKGIPCAYIEYGMLPQGKHFFVDTDGFCGRSMLNKPLGWLTAADRSALAAAREGLRAKHPCRDENFVLVTLQIHHDSQVLFNSGYRNMQDLIDHLEAIIPGPIVFRPHPKGQRDYAAKRSEVTREGDLMDWVSRARSVVAISSTCLYEAAVYGKPVLALGAHPFRSHHPARHDDVAAAALAVNVKRGAEGDLAGVLERFGVRPMVDALAAKKPYVHPSVKAILGAAG